VLVIETFFAALEPVLRFPKLRELGEAESCKVEATPVPLKAIVVGELGASLRSARLPAKVPADAGAKRTLKEEAPPGAIERGVASPDKVYPVAFNDACEMVSVEDPGFCTVIVCVLVALVMTLPKLRPEGATEISGCTPVPLSGMIAGEFVAVLTTVMLPEKFPAVVGAKPTLNEELCPEARVRDPEKPLTLNPAPEEVNDETVTDPVPVLVKVTA